jgi:Glycosyl hydrolase catalytic core
MLRLLALVAMVVAAASVASTASASSRLIKGLFDEANTLTGNPDRTFPILGQLRTKALRTNLYWGGRYGVASSRPVAPTDPDDPSYDWALYDRTVNYAQQFGIKVVFSIFGTPRWANGGRGLNVAPTKPIDLQRFARAAARRYSGRWLADDGRGLPRVDFWLAWNEPNNPVFLKPQYKRVGARFVRWAPREYARICNAVVTGVHGAGFRSQKVACGATAPGGNNNPRASRASISPVAFLRSLKAGGAKGFDAYAHHPYHANPSESPTTPPKGENTVTFGNINVLIRELTRLYGNKRFWITEYGYQTNPPDKIFGVSWKKQAAYLKQAYARARAHPRIDMLLWFLLKDDTARGGWQSGLMTASGRHKASFVQFRRIR